MASSRLPSRFLYDKVVCVRSDLPRLTRNPPPWPRPGSKRGTLWSKQRASWSRTGQGGTISRRSTTEVTWPGQKLPARVLRFAAIFRGPILAEPSGTPRHRGRPRRPRCRFASRPATAYSRSSHGNSLLRKDAENSARPLAATKTKQWRLRNERRNGGVKTCARCANSERLPRRAFK